MDEDKFDVIVVGGGIAGCTCALLLARAGVKVLLLERASHAGGKNVSGGRLYTYSLDEIIPGFANQAPLERQITHEKFSLLTADSAVTLDYHHPIFSEGSTSYSVLRSRFDPWLMAQAEAAGAQCLTGVQVDSLIEKQGVICGVKAGDDEIYARAVVLSEGANTLLAERHNLVSKPQPKTMAVGVKEVLTLDSDVIEERFALEENEGTAWLFAGNASAGKVGGGFVYTNRDTLSLGVVCNLSALSDANQNLAAMLENFKQHPAVRPLIRKTELLEYSAHLIPEGGINCVPPLSGAGYVIIGDAAGLCVNAGHTVRGMDLAVLSAKAAAQALIDASQTNSFTAQSLAHYRAHLESGSLWSVLQQYRSLPETLLQTPALFERYPQLAADILQQLYRVNGTSAKPLRKIIWNNVRRAGLFKLIKDGIRGARSL
ncbi:FAD-dependent oxidoreductase [Budvicia diplopodorum]|uniref:FAD-dependent oxidoreductase n=1 Tax=Budvicia diplopodorum TaxID=1119056 RepID=UPI00135766AC|nr:FAD-dependent oxidoreductase [Budvicia diplopodorum]